MIRAAMILLVCFVTASISADEVTLEKVPPVVVETSPEAGADDVDPKTTTIKVTFSKTMADGSGPGPLSVRTAFPRRRAKPSI